MLTDACAFSSTDKDRKFSHSLCPSDSYRACKYEKVQAAYKDKIDKSALNPETLVVGSIYGGLIFNFENKTVKSIFIGASAE